jgi:hypothetical protein
MCQERFLLLPGESQEAFDALHETWSKQYDFNEPPPPEFVYRRINFPDGIPDEYRWTNSQASPERLKRGGCGIQRMTVDTWLNIIEREKLRDDGHIGPTGVGNLPRPQETGGCNCPTCTHNQAIFDARAAQSEFVP